MKKLLTVTMILFFITSTVNASSIRGDFEGNPIVSVKTNGSDLKVEDVPAINYNGRTMVPIYMLRQLGADVAWDDSSYSVNVSLPNKNDTSSNNDLSLLSDCYNWLSDTDYAFRIYAENLNYYLEVASPSSYSQLIDLEFQTLTSQFTESLDFANRIKKSIKSDNKIDDIIFSQSKTMEQITKSKNLLQAWMADNSNSNLSAFKQSMLATLQLTQKNITTTKSIHHEFILQTHAINKE